MDAALLEKTPVGSPFSSFRILPPEGSGVSRVTPIFCMAQVLAEKVCRSTCWRNTGRSEM